MSQVFATPSIEITIGQQSRCYHTSVTTVPPSLDGPSTITLFASQLADVAGLARDPLCSDPTSIKTPGRLVLIASPELTRYRGLCRSGPYVCVPADPILVGLNALQQWLWQRLGTPLPATNLTNSGDPK